ncbi:hypothetical protein HDU97_006111 [Phlyctochytrium planicorne]|nr:hypothetical protein HDU97_006111 [Phlyctochytrium planicorne]
MLAGLVKDDLVSYHPSIESFENNFQCIIKAYSTISEAISEIMTPHHDYDIYKFFETSAFLSLYLLGSFGATQNEKEAASTSKLIISMLNILKQVNFLLAKRRAGDHF